MGVLTLDILAKIGGFERGMDQAERKSSRTAAQIARDQKKRAQEMEQAWANAGTAIGVGLSAATAALAVWIKGSVDAIDQFNDLKDVTGSSIENISALDSIARQTGGTFEQVSSTLTKFNGVLKDADPTKGPGAVLKALNLDIEELKKLDPAEALRQTAVALQRFADDGDKARAVQELFGKSVKETAPFLKDLAEAGELQAKVTTQAAEEIDRFNKEMARAMATVDDLGRALTIDLVSSINDVSDAFTKGRAAGKGFFEIASDRYWKNIKDFYRDVGLLEKEAPKFQPTFGVDDQSAAEMARLLRQPAMPSLEVPGDPKKPPKGPRKDNEAERAAKEAQSYLEKLQLQLRATEELTAVETVLRDIQDGRLKLAGGVTEAQLVGLAQQIDLDKQLLEATEQFKKLDEETLERKKRLAEAGRAVYESTRTPAEELNVELTKLNDLLTQGVVSWDTYARAVFDAQDAFDGAMKGGQDAVKGLDDFAKNAAQNIQENLGSSLADILNGDFENIGNSFVKMINRMIAEAMAAKLARYLFGDMVQGGTGSGAAGDIFGAFMNAISGAPGKANGGGVLAGGLYEVNEDGPEMLAMGGKQYLMMGNQGGRVIPTGDGSAMVGGSGAVTVNVINQGGGSLAVTGQRQSRGADGSMNIDVMVEALQGVMADNLANGSGSLARAMEGRYGLRTAVS